MTTQTEIAERNHRRTVRFFWSFLIGATLVSLTGNIAHAIGHLIPFVVVQIGTAAVPPLFLLAVVHGIGLSVRAGASGTVYRWAVTATAVIGVGAFVVSFRALRDLVIHTGIPPVWAWLFPAIIDTAIGVSTLMLVALGDKPVRRPRAVGTQLAPAQRPAQGANAHFKAPARRQPVQQSLPQGLVPSAPERAQTSAPSVLSCPGRCAPPRLRKICTHAPVGWVLGASCAGGSRGLMLDWCFGRPRFNYVAGEPAT
jgi:hypothetical protein